MTTATPKDGPLPDDYLREIGRVAVEWSKVEAGIETSIWAFLFVDANNTSPWFREHEGRAITTHINLLLRIDMMLSICSTVISILGPFDWIPQETESIARAARDIYPRRNKVVHSLWSPIGNEALRQSFRARGQVSPFYDVMTLDDVKNVGDEAAALASRIDVFIPKLSEFLHLLRRGRRAPYHG